MNLGKIRYPSASHGDVCDKMSDSYRRVDKKNVDTFYWLKDLLLLREQNAGR